MRGESEDGNSKERVENYKKKWSFFLFLFPFYHSLVGGKEGGKGEEK